MRGGLVSRLLAFLLLALPLWGQSFGGQITFQELLPYTGSTYPTGQNRTAYPASVVFPLAAGDAPASWWNSDGTPTGSNQLGLTTATVGQFRCLAWHSDGSCQSVLVDTEVTNNFSSTANYTGVSLSLSGSGNFGGSALAVDNAKILSDGSGCETTGTSSGYICVNTGTLRAQIKKSGFDGFNKVVAGSTVLINGSSDGLTVAGPDTTVSMPSAPSAPSVSAASGGTYSSSSTLYVKVACVGESGESLASSASGAVSVGSGQLLKVTAPNCVPDSGNNGYNVYAGTSAGSVRLQNIQPIDTTTDWTEPTACPFAGSGCVSGRGIITYLHYPLAYAGNSDGCGMACTTAYKTSLDTSSTATIEENGPVKAVIRVKAANSNGTVSYLKEDTKFVFFKNSNLVRQPVLLKNADDPCPSATSGTDTCYNSTHFASDYKGFAAHEMRIKPAFTVTDFISATDTTPLSVTLDGSHDAYLFQGYSQTGRTSESDGTAYCTGISVACAVHDVLRYPDASGVSTPNGSVTFAQKGYKIVGNGSTQATNATGGSWGMGWADFTGSSGQGIQVGFWSMATEWPKALQAKYVTDHYEIRAGILPDQTLFDSATAQPYYIAWPQYRMATIVYNFHSTSLSDAGGDFLKAQYYLVGRATVDAYNRAQIFPKAYPLLDPVAVDNWAKSVGMYCPGTAGTCVPATATSSSGASSNPSFARRSYDWTQAAEGNQNDWDWQYVADFLQRGLTGRLWTAVHDARYFIAQELPRADGFTWRSRPVGSLDGYGYPEAPGVSSGGKYRPGNAQLATRNWNGNVDGGAHSHFYGGPLYTWLTISGDSFLKDALDQAWGDFTLNPSINAIVHGGEDGQGFGQQRAAGQQITHRAQYYLYALSQKDLATAVSALSLANTILNNAYPLTLQISGFGTNYKGVSPSRGVPRVGQSLDSSAVDGLLSAANISSITCNSAGNKATVVMASNLPIQVGSSNFTPPEVVRVAGVPSGNFNGDVTLDAITDQQHFTYPAACTANATCSGGGSCGTVNIPGKCPIDTNGTCNARYVVDSFMEPLVTQGLVELSDATQSATSDPNAVWARHNLTYDTALGILRFSLYDIMLSQSGQPGGVYWSYPDYYNSDKHYSTHTSCRENVAYSTWGLWWQLVGTVTTTEENTFAGYAACKWASSYSLEYGSPMFNASLSHLTGFPNAATAALVNATHSDSCVASDGDSGSPHCHLSVTVPTGATRYRIKARSDGKAIVDSLNFDHMTNPHSDGSGCTGKYWSGVSGDWSGCYGLNPATNWPFFSSTEVSSLPVPSGTTQDIVVSASNFSSFNASTLSQNKFAVKALTGGESLPPPENSVGSVLRGGAVKGGVVR